MTKQAGRAMTAAEFFAGMGLVRRGVERAGFQVRWANDLDPSKALLYAANHDERDFHLGDVCDVRGGEVPAVELATASFPCTDLSLAGNRAGLRERASRGEQSSMFWEFARVLGEMGERRPHVVMLENVPGFATSHGGADLRRAVARLNELGYSCDVLAVDARRFVAQSRPRLFIVGTRGEPPAGREYVESELRPRFICQWAARNSDLILHAADVRLPPAIVRSIAEVVERIAPGDERWWSPERVERFVASLSPIQSSRLRDRIRARRLGWATAYRRTRGGKPVWEIRADEISGCLRTARGGSSKQALVEAGRGQLRVRWMTPREYARLQGADDVKLDAVSENQALFALGDAVCVPAVAWVATAYLRPLLVGELADTVEVDAVEAVGGAA